MPTAGDDGKSRPNAPRRARLLRVASLSSAGRKPRETPRPLPRPAPAPGAISAAVAASEAAGEQKDPCRGVRNVAGRPSRADRARRARDRNRHQRNEPAPHPRSSTKTRPRKFAPPPACDRAGRRARRDFRPDRLHRRASPSERPGRGLASAPRRPRRRRRHACHGLRALWTRRHLHDAGLLPASGHRRRRRRTARPRRRRSRRCPSTIRSPAS